ncbi:Cytochrome P450 81Q32 [Euphorbia peplus]|nr:Cytochrome P450 81Q32 [Euphorbia peplus]
MDSSFYYFLFFLFLYVLTKNLIRFKIKKLPPSPGISLPIIGHLYLFKKPLHRTFARLSIKYGPILYLNLGSRPVILISSPEAAEECFTKNDILFANRPKLLAGKHLGYDYTTLVWASYGDHWRNLRRIASLELLSSHRLQLFSNIRLEEVRSMVHALFRHADTREFEFFGVEMKTMFFELTLNVIMRMIAGKRYYGEKTDGVDEESRFKEIIRETFELSGATFADFVPGLKGFGMNKIEKRLAELQRKRDRFMQELIDEHKKGELEKSSKSMINVLIELQKQEPEYYSDEIIRGLMLVMLSAGSDTSAGTMEWAFSLLLNNPETLLKSKQEIDKNIGPNKLIEESDLPNLPYLQGIINETLRMHPPAPLIPPHESSQECTVGGYTVPRGTMLMVNVFAIQNDPKLWEEPTKFRPERHLEAQRDGYVMLPFGTGRRGCPGEGLALRIVGLALGSFIQCFEWKRVGDEMVNMEEGSGLTSPRAHPLVALCSPRPALLNLLSQL